MTGTSVEPEVQPEVLGTKLKQKKYVVIGIVIVLSVVAASIWLMFPRTSGILPLNVQYTKGEKLTYAIKMSTKTNIWGGLAREYGMMWTKPANLTMEVLDVENGTYTICYTLTMTQTQARDLGLNETTVNITATINDNGQVLSLSGENTPTQTQNVFSSFTGLHGFGSYFSKNESKVGDSWYIPINMTTKEMNMTGIINNTITWMGKISVTAGRYDTFKVDLSSCNFTTVMKDELLRVQVSIGGYEYLERNTCLPIKYQLTTTTLTTLLSRKTGEPCKFAKVTVSITMTLIQYTR